MNINYDSTKRDVLNTSIIFHEIKNAKISMENSNSNPANSREIQGEQNNCKINKITSAQQKNLKSSETIQIRMVINA